MTQNSPLVISISRQIGCGGAYLGQRIAQKLNILYLDREILCKAAQKLDTTVTELEFRDEKVQPFWKWFVEKCANLSAGSYSPPVIDYISEQDIFKAETSIIKKIAQKESCIIIGRGGAYALKNHPKHISIFLHADIAFRQKRVAEIYKMSESEALKQIKHTDEARSRYLEMFTKKSLTDACQYDLCINTAMLDLDTIENIILEYIKARR